jgi:hypothetical protein
MKLLSSVRKWGVMVDILLQEVVSAEEIPERIGPLT